MLRKAMELRMKIELWLARRRHRQALADLAALSERTLLDLGFDPDELRAEAVKPFWRD